MRRIPFCASLFAALPPTAALAGETVGRLAWASHHSSLPVESSNEMGLLRVGLVLVLGFAFSLVCLWIKKSHENHGDESPGS